MDRPIYVEDTKTTRFRLRTRLRQIQNQIDFHMNQALKLEDEKNDLAKQIAELPSE